jgi:hypothetical protein
MEGGIFLHRKDREALRERWLLRAGKAFERMFAETNQDQLVTFTEREDLAWLLGKELAAFLLEEHAAADNQVRPSEKRPPFCPKCKQPGERVLGPAGYVSRPSAETEMHPISPATPIRAMGFRLTTNIRLQAERGFSLASGRSEVT